MGEDKGKAGSKRGLWQIWLKPAKREAHSVHVCKSHFLMENIGVPETARLWGNPALNSTKWQL